MTTRVMIRVALAGVVGLLSQGCPTPVVEDPPPEKDAGPAPLRTNTSFQGSPFNSVMRLSRSSGETVSSVPDAGFRIGQALPTASYRLDAPPHALGRFSITRRDDGVTMAILGVTSNELGDSFTVESDFEFEVCRPVPDAGVFVTCALSGETASDAVSWTELDYPPYGQKPDPPCALDASDAGLGGKVNDAGVASAAADWSFPAPNGADGGVCQRFRLRARAQPMGLGRSRGQFEGTFIIRLQ